MFIFKGEYEKLVEKAQMVDELEKEVSRLATLISVNNQDCNVGAWCTDCEHLGTDYAEVRDYPYGGFSPVYTSVIGGEVIYCKKHLHDICPEHSKVNVAL